MDAVSNLLLTLGTNVISALTSIFAKSAIKPMVSEKKTLKLITLQRTKHIIHLQK